MMRMVSGEAIRPGILIWSWKWRTTNASKCTKQEACALCGPSMSGTVESTIMASASAMSYTLCMTTARDGVATLWKLISRSAGSLTIVTTQSTVSMSNSPWTRTSTTNSWRRQARPTPTRTARRCHGGTMLQKKCFQASSRLSRLKLLSGPHTENTTLNGGASASLMATTKCAHTGIAEVLDGGRLRQRFSSAIAQKVRLRARLAFDGIARREMWAYSASSSEHNSRFQLGQKVWKVRTTSARSSIDKGIAKLGKATSDRRRKWKSPGVSAQAMVAIIQEQSGDAMSMSCQGPFTGSTTVIPSGQPSYCPLSASLASWLARLCSWRVAVLLASAALTLAWLVWHGPST
mmetsp:Transcript_31249/g.57157  ORF Transcript_31249/g.57157 Transcript_31249/m.57157 type:complete len:348 (+) Transcript_31249:710-1753(+)